MTGSGTFVASGVHSADTFIEKKNRYIEMGMIKPVYETNGLVLAAAQSILGHADAVGLLEYSSPLGTDRQLAAAGRWLQKYKVNVTKHGVIIAAGAQNALSVILISLFQAGDKIAVDEFTYTNFKGLANLLHIQLIAACQSPYAPDCGSLLWRFRSSTVTG